MQSLVLYYYIVLLHYVCGIPTGVQHGWAANEIKCRSKIVNYHPCSVCKIWEVGKRSDACFFRGPLEQPDTVRALTASSGTQTVGLWPTQHGDELWSTRCGRHGSTQVLGSTVNSMFRYCIFIASEASFLVRSVALNFAIYNIISGRLLFQKCCYMYIRRV